MTFSSLSAVVDPDVTAVDAMMPVLARSLYPLSLGCYREPAKAGLLALSWHGNVNFDLFFLETGIKLPFDR